MFAISAALWLALLFAPSAAAAVSFVASSSAQSSGTSISVAAPSGITLDDLLIAQITVRDGTSVTLTPPAGWTLLRREDNGTTLAQALYYRWATAAEATSYSWDVNPGNRDTGIIVAYRGVDKTSPFNAHAGQANANSGSITTPSISTAVADTMLVGFFGIANGNGSLTAPASMAVRDSIGTAGGPNGVNVLVADELKAATGASGSRTADSSAPNLNIGQLIALSPVVIVVAPGQFNAFERATPAGATTGVIKTKIAGSPIELDVVALNASRTALVTTFSDAVKVELLNTQDNSGALDANSNCRSSWTVIQALGNFTFSASDNGRKTIFFQENGAWRNARVRITYPAAGTATTIGCSSDNFAVRPAKLANVSIKDANWNTAGTARSLANVSASGGVVHKAGQPFTLSATAINALASPATTTGYGGTPVASLTACILPAGCTAANLGTFSTGTWSSSAGVVTSSTATYSEVGAFTMQLEDRDFAGVDASDSTTLERYFSSDPISVGRFVPDHFRLGANNTPQFKTFNATSASCPARSFTYIGQPFGYLTAPRMLVTAENANNATTANYAGALWKIAAPAASAPSCTASPDQCTGTAGNIVQTYTYTLTPAASPNWDSTQVAIGTPGVIAFNDGTGTITANASDKLAFLRNVATAQSPFAANIALSFSVSDSAEAAGTGIASCTGSPSPCAINAAAPAVFNGTGSGIGFDSGNTFRYGLMRLSGAYGSDQLNLLVPAELLYWNGSAFTRNIADSCTAVQTSNITLNPTTCTSISGATLTFASGAGNLTLQKSGAACRTDITVKLDAASESKAYLQGRWAGNSFIYNPTARATFGIYKSGSVIYMREIY